MSGMNQLRVLFNRWRRRLARFLLYRMAFGERSAGRWLPYTRISPSTCIEHEDRLLLGDHVYIGPFNLIDASGGVTIDDGVQITSHVSIVSHSSHRAQRLLGEGFVNWPGARFGQRPGWISGPVVIGRYSFIGPHSLIEANTRLGRGTLVCAGSFVRGDYPEFAILEGRPARVVGDSRRADERLLERYPDLRPLYDAWAGAAVPVEPGQAAEPGAAGPEPQPADKVMHEPAAAPARSPTSPAAAPARSSTNPAAAPARSPTSPAAAPARSPASPAPAPDRSPTNPAAAPARSPAQPAAASKPGPGR